MLSQLTPNQALARRSSNRLATTSRCPQIRCRANGTVPNQLVKDEIRAIKTELSQLLATIEERGGPIAGILPGNDTEKARIEDLLKTLQRDDYKYHLRWDDLTPGSQQVQEYNKIIDTNMLGTWQLCYASNGTVVTRTMLAQALVTASKSLALPGFGLSDVTQGLSADTDGAIRSSNSAVFGLGPLGSWQVGVEGSWKNTGDGKTVWVAFDRFKIRPVNWLGLSLPEWLPQMVVDSGAGVGDSRSGAEWVTTYCDEDYRIGKGKTSGNLFLFRRVLANNATGSGTLSAAP